VLSQSPCFVTSAFAISASAAGRPAFSSYSISLIGCRLQAARIVPRSNATSIDAPPPRHRRRGA
jgi:hypothetical protein